MSRFKVGDRVVVVFIERDTSPGGRLIFPDRSVHTIIDISEGDWVKTQSHEYFQLIDMSEYASYKLVHEHIYNSTLYQALNEEE